MTTTKPTTTTTSEQDDDVILHMEELPPRSNGLNNGSTDVIIPTTAAAGEEQERPASATSIATTEAKPHHLLETDNVNNNPRTKYHSDIDDFEVEPRGRSRERYPAVDDGFLPDYDDEPGSMRPSSPRLQPIGFSGFPRLAGGASVTPDLNVYQQKKTIAQGMMDLALISANANQFRYVLQSSSRHPYYYTSLIMIALSLLLQIIIGIGLIWNSRYNVKEEDQIHKANRANNLTVLAIFIVTILNVFISSFGIVDASDTGFTAVNNNAAAKT